MMHRVVVSSRPDSRSASAEPQSIVVRQGDTICWSGEGVAEFSVAFEAWPAGEVPASTRVSESTDHCVTVGRFERPATVGYRITVGGICLEPEIIFDPD